MRTNMNGPEAQEAIEQGKIVYDNCYHCFFWKDVIHDPIGGDTPIIYRHTASETLKDISPNVSVLRRPLDDPSRRFVVYDPNFDKDTLSMREAYEAMKNGKIVYDVDDPDFLYFMVNIATPFGNITRVFFQDKYNADPEISYWDEESNGITRYKIRQCSDDRDE